MDKLLVRYDDGPARRALDADEPTQRSFARPESNGRPCRTRPGGNDVEPREVVAPETRSRPDTAAWTFFRVRLSCSAGTGSRRSDCSCLDRPGPNTNLPGKHRSHLFSRNRPRQPPIWPGWGLITTAACFRRSRSLPFLCTSFCPNSCHRPVPCSRFDLCTRVLVAAFERQPSSRG
jgi:hypothetical protein